jgi:hypothetical protein
MKRVDTIARVRRAFYVQGWSVKKIVRELHVSRNTVRKILRTDETDFSYERERQPMPRIGPWHYVPVLARKPGALRNGAPFKDWVLPPAMAAIRRKLKGSDDGDRQMVQILSCVPDDGLQAVEAACREAVDQGVHSAPVVINILARRRDPTPPPLLLTPTALRLTHEPVADCARYDSLRRTSRHGTHPNLRPDGQPQALRDAQRL